MKIGIIGGSGLYDMKEMTDKKWIKIATPFGDPSDEYLTGKIGGADLIFLPRHARGHKILPSELNYRANIYGMKKLGAEWIISVAAVGSLKEEIRPMDIVIVDQFVDRTNQARKMTFFGEGVCGHIAFADPTCPVLNKILYDAALKTGARVFDRGTYLNMEGPAFSTRAESNLYRQWGMDIIGMTNMPEAKLAREAEICYSAMAMVTDYDCWRELAGNEHVSIEMVIRNLMKNVETARQVIGDAVLAIPRERTCACASALKDGIITNPKFIPDNVKEKLSVIMGKYLR